MIHKKNIYGVKVLIHGSILLTNIRTEKQKWFIVSEIEDCPENRKDFYPEVFGVLNIRLTSDYNISQKEASLMKQISSDKLLPPKGYRF